VEQRSHPTGGTAEEIPQDVALRLQLALIAGNDRAAYIEARSRKDGKYVARFCDTARVADAAHQLWSSGVLSDRTADLFVGVCPRVRKPGSGLKGCGTDADVARAWALWADLDTAESVANLQGFDHEPSLLVSSGGGVHAYWQLDRPAPVELIKRANRRIAYRLGADPAATNPARILRMIGSWNVKRGKVVVATHLEPIAYRPGELVDHLDDHPKDRPRQPRRNVLYLPGVSAEERLSGPLRRLRAASKGERNNMLFWASCVARDEVGDSAEAHELLRAAALAVGLDQDRIEGTIASAWRSVA
jgi:hypothetical protein